MDSLYLPFNSKVGNLRKALSSTCNIYHDIPTIITGHIMKGMEWKEWKSRPLIFSVVIFCLLTIFTDKSEKPRLVPGT